MDLLASYNYSSWGTRTTASGTATSPFGFAGGYTDQTGLVYFVHRYYDPMLRQFISVDPAVATTGTPYAYAGNNPVNGADPSGLCHGFFGCIGSGLHAVAHFVGRHWRGIVQGVAVVAGAVAAAGCIAATAGVCAGVLGTVLTVGGFGGLTGDVIYSASGDQLTAAGYAQAFGLGAIGGIGAAACGLSVGTICATAFGASAFNGLIGGLLGAEAYASGTSCGTLGGYADAFAVGLLQSEPIPIPDWLVP